LAKEGKAKRQLAVTLFERKGDKHVFPIFACDSSISAQEKSFRQQWLSRNSLRSKQLV
jgi:hypothetical protein